VCEILSLTLKKGHKNRVLRKIFGPKKDEVTEGGEGYITRNFMIYTPQQILCG
jgi:hypothetical protein